VSSGLWCSSSPRLGCSGYELVVAWSPFGPEDCQDDKISPVTEMNLNLLTGVCCQAKFGIDQSSWRKASHSAGNGECIEVGDGLVRHVAVRDSKSPAGPALVYSTDQWESFLAKVRILPYCLSPSTVVALLEIRL
jgi:hypothetical protein